MKRFIFTLILFTLAAPALRAEEGVTIPVAIHEHLEVNYPGWKLTPINKRLIAPWNKGAYSNFLQADINGDKATDYALEINYIDSRDDVQTAALAFLAEGGKFHEYSLTDIWVGSDHKLTYAPSETVLRFVAKGQPGYRAGDEEQTSPKERPAAPIYKENVIEVITLNRAVSAMAFDGAGFRQVRKANQGQDRQ